MNQDVELSYSEGITEDDFLFSFLIGKKVGPNFVQYSLDEVKSYINVNVFWRNNTRDSQGNVKRIDTVLPIFRCNSQQINDFGFKDTQK